MFVVASLIISARDLLRQKCNHDRRYPCHHRRRVLGERPRSRKSLRTSRAPNPESPELIFSPKAIRAELGGRMRVEIPVLSPPTGSTFRWICGQSDEHLLEISPGRAERFLRLAGLAFFGLVISGSGSMTAPLTSLVDLSYLDFLSP
jgi:hypothetical protein